MHRCFVFIVGVFLFPLYNLRHIAELEKSETGILTFLLSITKSNSVWVNPFCTSLRSVSAHNHHHPHTNALCNSLVSGLLMKLIQTLTFRPAWPHQQPVPFFITLTHTQLKQSTHTRICPRSERDFLFAVMWLNIINKAVKPSCSNTAIISLFVDP